MRSFEVTTSSVEETGALGARLGAVLRIGDFVAVEGELGAGKTRLVEGIARGFGVDPARRIPSPTFTLVNEHPGRGPLVHADLYRLAGPQELYELGWTEYLAGGALVVVEWLSVVGGDPAVAPLDRVEVRLRAPDAARPDLRELGFVATGPRGAAILAAMGL